MERRAKTACKSGESGGAAGVTPQRSALERGARRRGAFWTKERAPSRRPRRPEFGTHVTAGAIPLLRIGRVRADQCLIAPGSKDHRE